MCVECGVCVCVCVWHVCVCVWHVCVCGMCVACVCVACMCVAYVISHCEGARQHCIIVVCFIVSL